MNPASTVPGETSGRVQGPSGVAPDLPERLGRYRIIKPLGRGGMGSVYLAHDVDLDRRVALKVPHITPADPPELLQRFEREARIAATIEHPGLCPVYDVGRIGDIHYLTMPYIAGKSLAEVIDPEKPIPLRQAAAVVHRLALALEEAHSHGVVHRDLKPSNIIASRTHELVIIDFGLARRVDSDDLRVTKSGAIVGTPYYMAPEQITGDRSAVGPACDIYSLGVIFYELMTGHCPFEGPAAMVLGLIMVADPPPPSSYRPEIDPTLEAICLKAMAKDPASRYRHCRELAEDLRRFINAEPTTAGRAAETELTPAWRSPRRLMALGAGLGVLCLAGVVLLSSHLRRVPSHPPVAGLAPDRPAPPRNVAGGNPALKHYLARGGQPLLDRSVQSPDLRPVYARTLLRANQQESDRRQSAPKDGVAPARAPRPQPPRSLAAASGAPPEHDPDADRLPTNHLGPDEVAPAPRKAPDQKGATTIETVLDAPKAFEGRTITLDRLYKVGTLQMPVKSPDGRLIGWSLPVGGGDDRLICKGDGKVVGRDRYLILDGRLAPVLKKAFDEYRFRAAARPAHKCTLTVTVRPMAVNGARAPVVVIVSLEILGICNFVQVAQHHYDRAFMTVHVTPERAWHAYGDGAAWVERLGGQEKFIAPLHRKLRDLQRKVMADRDFAVVGNARAGRARPIGEHGPRQSGATGALRVGVPRS